MRPSVTVCETCGIVYDSAVSSKCPFCAGVVKAEPLKAAASYRAPSASKSGKK